MGKKFLCIFFVALLSLAPIFLASRPVLAGTGAVTPTNGMAATLVLGQPDFTSSAAAITQTGMTAPYGVSVDPTTGKIFVANYSNNRVLRFASARSLANGAAAEAVLGQADFTHGQANRGGTTAANSLNQPYGLFVDSAGRLWVADAKNNRVLRFDNASTKANGADADGVLGQPDLTSSAFATTQSGMAFPYDLFVDSSGRLWESDSWNHRVLRFDNAAAKANGANADGVLGQVDFTSYTPATSQNRMYYPAGLFVDWHGRLWVGDYYNNRVLRFDNAAAKTDGGDADGVLGQADFTSSISACTQGGMALPIGISGDLGGRLYVADSHNNRVLIYKGAAGLPNGANAQHGLGQTNFTTCTSNTGGVSATSLDTPTGVFFDPAASILWVTDLYNSRVLMYGNTAQAATLVLGQHDFTTFDMATNQTGMKQPYGVSVDPTTGKVFGADYANNRVLRFASVTALANGAAAEAVLGQADFIHNFDNRGGPVAANSMYFPFGLSVDSAGRLWVADTSNHRVLRFDNASAKGNGADADGVLGQVDLTHNTSAIGQSGMYIPVSVFADSSGRLWVADNGNGRVLRFDNAAAKPGGGNADGVLGQGNYTSKFCAITQNGMCGPSGVFVDLAGRLWVADNGNNRVLRFEGAAAKANGAAADGVLGRPNFTSYSSACTQGEMYHPGGISGDLAGRLYVADVNNNRVLIYQGAAGLANGANAQQVLGQPNFSTCTSNTGGVSAASLSTPESVFFDTATNVLWVTDWSNNRMLMYGNLYPAATLVLGQPGFTSNATATTQSGMYTPYSVKADPTTGKVFVADASNHRVQRFASAGALANGAAAEAVLGQADFTHGQANRGGTTAANSMNQPFGLFVDTAGRLWVADVSNNRVLRFDHAAAKANGAAADGVLGQPDFASSASATSQSGMNLPVDVFVDASGRLWAADYGNNRVLRFDNAAAKPDGANADSVLGQEDFTSSSYATTQDGMYAPAGLFVDWNGRLWVSDNWNHRVLRFDNAAAKNMGADADGVLGQADFTSNSTVCTQGKMYLPVGVSGDPAGRLYVADGDHHRVLIYEDAAGLPDGANALHVLGQPDFTTCNPNTGGLSVASLKNPTSVSFDPAVNVLWVADWQNSRVLMYGTAQFRMFLPMLKK